MTLTALSSPLTVSQANERVRALVSPLGEVQVQGEVSGAKISNGHLYFELKDGSSRLRVNVWKPTVQRLRVEVRDGQQLTITGKIDVWVPGGSYALIASRIESTGLGALFLALAALKDKLQREGLFDAAIKKPLPFLPRAVGLVTALGGAALRDMVRILTDRFPVRIIVVGVKVQGEGAAETIAQGIERLDGSGLVDVIIVGRGGGSLEDLWAFNEERVIRAVAACRTPIVSAVGHETDTLLSDYAADVRAPTPTAAAEMVVPRIADLKAQLRQYRQRIALVSRRGLVSERRHWQQLLARLGDGGSLTGPRSQRLDELTMRLRHGVAQTTRLWQKRLNLLGNRLHAAHPLRRLDGQRRRLEALQVRLRHAMHTRMTTTRQHLAQKNAVLAALSPKAALQRGYGILRTPAGNSINSVSDLAVGVQLQVVLADGYVGALVQEVHRDGEGNS